MSDLLGKVKRFLVRRLPLRREGAAFQLLRNAYRSLYRLTGRWEMRRLLKLQGSVARSDGAVRGYLVRGEECFVELSDGARFLWDPVDPNDLLGVAIRGSGGDFEREELLLWDKLLRPGDHIIDIGANFGWHAVRYRRIAGEAGLLVAFEPVPAAFAELERNMAENFSRAKNIALERRAVGDTNATTTIYVPRNLGTAFSSVMKEAVRGPADALRVETVTLDSYLREKNIRRVDFVKCDVEGAEMLVLKGAHELLSGRQAPMFFVEVNQEGDRETFAIMKKYGYEPYYFRTRELLRADPRASVLPDFNFLFAKPMHDGRLRALLRRK